MSTKVTDLDRAIARNIKALRETGGLTQRHVADFLQFSYQSYQKLEGGKISFRASTLDRLAKLYNKRLHELIEGAETETDPQIAKSLQLLHGMDDEARDTAIRAILLVKQRTEND